MHGQWETMFGREEGTLLPGREDSFYKNPQSPDFDTPFFSMATFSDMIAVFMSGQYLQWLAVNT